MKQEQRDNIASMFVHDMRKFPDTATRLLRKDLGPLDVTWNVIVNRYVDGGILVFDEVVAGTNRGCVSLTEWGGES